MEESIAAVIAHGLLNSLAVVQGAIITLATGWDALTQQQRADLAEAALSQAEVMADGLDALPDHARHRLANHLFVLRGACQSLKRDGDALPPGERQHFVGVVKRQTEQAAGVLANVVRALPDGVQSLLNQLDEDRDRQHSDARG
jgi:hypothetical protein